MKVKKYKLPCKVDSILIGIDKGNPRFDDRGCNVLIARLCDGRLFLLETKFI